MGFVTKLLGGGKLPTPAPLPPLPTREDPEIDAARKRQATADKLRKGRRSSILTSSSGTTDSFNAERPAATGVTKLGQ